MTIIHTDRRGYIGSLARLAELWNGERYEAKSENARHPIVKYSKEARHNKR